MFAAVLIVCSLYAVTCELISMPVYATEQDCREGAALFVASHQPQLTKGYGPHEVSVWCRKMREFPT